MHTFTPSQCATLFDCMAADRLVGAHRLTLSAIQVLRTLLFKYRNKKTSECWPSRASLAAASGLSLRTVGYALKLLKDAGWLSWWRRRKRISRLKYVQDSSLYQIRIPRRWRRVISECKNRPGTTSLLTKVACGQLTRTDKGVPNPPKEATEVPEGYGHNHIHPDCEPGVARALSRLAFTLESRGR